MVSAGSSGQDHRGSGTEARCLTKIAFDQIVGATSFVVSPYSNLSVSITPVPEPSSLLLFGWRHRLAGVRPDYPKIALRALSPLRRRASWNRAADSSNKCLSLRFRDLNKMRRLRPAAIRNNESVKLTEQPRKRPARFLMFRTTPFIAPARVVVAAAVRPASITEGERRRA